MGVSDYIKQADDDDVRQSRTRRNGRVDPTVLLERSFLQWNLLDSIGNAVVGWVIICTYLFWMDPAAQFLTFTGILFFLIGLVCFADIFGVLLYFTNYMIMVWQKKRNPPFPDLRYLKKLGWIANIIWFGIMFAAAKISFDLTYSFIHSIFHG